MNKLYCLLLFVLFQCISQTSFSQTEETEEVTDSVVSGVVIHADPRLDVLMATNVKIKKAYASSPGKTAKVIRSGRGFRVQIYNGNEKNAAVSKKVDFMRRFPSVKTYMTYTQPQFRVKVGDFQTRKDAQAFMLEIRSSYPAAMIVPDYIVINTFRK